MDDLESANAYVLLIAKKARRARARPPDRRSPFESDPTNHAAPAVFFCEGACTAQEA